MKYAARSLAAAFLAGLAVLGCLGAAAGSPRASAHILPPLWIPLGEQPSTQSTAPQTPGSSRPEAPSTTSEPPESSATSVPEPPTESAPSSESPGGAPPQLLPGLPPLPSLLPHAPLPGAPEQPPDAPRLPPLLPAPPPAPALPPVQGSGDSQPGPGRAWTLTASTLKLGGSRYKGYVEQDVGGRKVKTLHFTVDRMEITDLVQRGELGNGTDVQATSAPGGVSTVANGPIDLYTQQLTGTLAVGGYPLAPITLSPDSLALPNLDLGFLKLPDLTFRDAIVHNTDLAGGTLHIPGATLQLR